MARRRSRSRLPRAKNASQRRARRVFNSLANKLGGGPGGAGGGSQAGEGFAGFNFALTVDDSDFQADVAEAEARLDGLAHGGGSRLARPLSFGERIEGRVRALNSKVSRRLGLNTNATVTGGRRNSFLEFGAEGVRVGDLRLSRAGLSLSEKTFVGSAVLGYAAVAGQVAGHAIRAASNYDGAIRAHLGLQLPQNPGEATPGSSASVKLRVAGDFVVGGAYKLATQAASIFGGEELGGLLVYGLRKIGSLFGGESTTLGESIRDAQTNRNAIAEALDFGKMLERYRKEAVKFQKDKIKERQSVRAMWDQVRNDQINEFAADVGQAEYTLKTAGLETQLRLRKLKDVRGYSLLPVGSDMEGR